MRWRDGLVAGAASVLLPLLAVGVAAAGEAAKPPRPADRIRELLGQGRVDDAEKALEAALEQSPDDPLLQSLRYSMYLALRRADRPAEAAAQLDAFVQHRLGQAGESPVLLRNMRYYTAALASAYQAAGQPQTALERLDQVIAAIRQAAASASGASATALTQEVMLVRGVKAKLLADLGRQEEARALAERLAAEAKQEFAADPTPEAALALAAALQAQADALASLDPEQAEAAANERFRLLSEQAQRHPDNPALVSGYVSAVGSSLSTLARRDAAAAAKQLEEARQLIASLESDDAAVKRMKESAERLFDSLQRRIDAELLHQRLIGQPAFPIQADAWVNGAPLGDEQLKGKVVLLDFWAVWCGPCIATFPHLRAWRERYADRGLVIIGLTRYYGYGWDDEAGRPKRLEDASPSDELAALEKFAEHHQLKHRFAVMPKNSDLSQKYGVYGIPQAVLIDRKGVIRMIRVGSGEQNARELEQMIEQLLDESP